MDIPFIKYSGCSNDFVLIDNRELNLQLDKKSIVSLCDRREGVGADGVILIVPSRIATCKMHIYNSDGGEAEMCGNGIRCVADFIRNEGHNTSHCTIESMHRCHHASWKNDKYTIEMGSPEQVRWDLSIESAGNEYHLSYLDTGVPHVVMFCEDLTNYPLNELAPAIRYHEEFMPGGANVNIVQVVDDGVLVRTYERGVEAETPACGTGATAAALVAANKHSLASPVNVFLKSGDQLEIQFRVGQEGELAVSMTGTCKRIFKGTISLTSPVVFS